MKRMWSRNELKKNTLENLKVSDVKVKTIEQSEANDEILITPVEGIEIKSGYFACKIINNVLHLIMEGIFDTTDAFTAVTNMTLFNIQIPQKYRDKIFRWDGTNLSKNASSNNTITRDRYNLSVEGVGIDSRLMGLLSSSNSGNIDVFFWAHGLSASKTGNTLSVRTSLVLI